MCEADVRALLFDGRLRLATGHPEPTLPRGEARIRPALVGICNTDLELTRGYKQFRGVLGHEFVGTVVACEDSAWLGQRVVGEINAGCGRCAACARGNQSHCPNRTTLGIHGRDGAMADLFCLPIRCLHQVPDGVPDAVAVFTEPLAAAVEILEQTQLYPTDHVAVIGDGKLGLLCAQVVRLPGCAVTVVGRHPERWDWLHALGVQTLNARVLADTPDTTDAWGTYDVVVDCTGNAAGLALARRFVRPRGRLVLKTTLATASELDVNALVVDEIQVIGSRCGPFAPALRLLERGLVQTTPLLSGRYALDDGVAAFAAAQQQLKIVLEVST